MSNKWIKIVAAALIGVLLLPSCKMRRHVESHTTMSDVYAMPFNTLSAKMIFSAYQGERQLFSVGGQLKMKKDSITTISIQPLAGVEVARMTFTQDSVTIVDRMNKRYFKASFEEIKGKTQWGLNHHSFQAALTNTPFAYEKPIDASKTDFNETEMGNGDIFLQRGYKTVVQEFVMDAERKLQSGALMGNDMQVRWTYADFSSSMDGRPFPLKLEIKLQGTNNPFILAFAFKKISENEGSGWKWNYKIPDNYQMLTFDELISLFPNKR